MGKLRTEWPFYKALVWFLQPKICVEVGVAKGGAAEMICRALQDWDAGGKYYGFDAWKRYGQAEEFKALGSREVVAQRLDNIPFGDYHLFEVDTLKDQDKFRKLCPDNIDFAYIDADHSYYGIANDFSVIYPKLSAMGVIVFHDTCSIDGCREFVLDLRTKYYDGTFDLLDIPLGNGKNNRHPGITILMKRYWQIEKYCIDEVNGSPSQPHEIEHKEWDWLESEKRSNKDNMKKLNLNPKMDLTKLGRYLGRKKFAII